MWSPLFGDDAVERWRGGEGHLPADLLERLAPHGRLEVLRRLPLRDIDEAELRLWVQALMEPSREKARRMPQVLGGLAPRLEELLLLAHRHLEWVNEYDWLHRLLSFPFIEENTQAFLIAYGPIRPADEINNAKLHYHRFIF